MPQRKSSGAHHRRGFTLVEVLATMLLLGIVMPVAMRGISLALAAADTARHRSEAATLAGAKLNELSATGDVLGTTGAGDFGPAWAGYRWESQGTARDFGVTELAVTVAWTDRGSERSISVATLVSDVATGAGGAVP